MSLQHELLSGTLNNDMVIMCHNSDLVPEGNLEELYYIISHTYYIITLLCARRTVDEGSSPVPGSNL